MAKSAYKKSCIHTDVNGQSGNQVRTIERLYILNQKTNHSEMFLTHDSGSISTPLGYNQSPINMKGWTRVAVTSDSHKTFSSDKSPVPIIVTKETEVWVNDKYVVEEKTPYFKNSKQSVADESFEFFDEDSKYKMIINWQHINCDAYPSLDCEDMAISWFNFQCDYYQDALLDHDPNDILINCPNFKEEKNLGKDGTIESMYAKTKDGKIIFGFELIK